MLFTPTLFVLFKVLILLTDGQQTYVKNTRAPHLVAKELATEGIDIFSVGIGQEINRVELESFISKPEHIFLASDLSSLVADLSGDISRALKCEGSANILISYVIMRRK